MTMETEIPVTVDGTEKWITGLTRLTTFDDVIYAILQHHKVGDLPEFSSTVEEYAVYECKDHIERPLRGRTKVWRFLQKLDKQNVKYVLKKQEMYQKEGCKSTKYAKYYNRNGIKRLESQPHASSYTESDTDCENANKVNFKPTDSNSSKHSGDTLPGFINISPIKRIDYSNYPPESKQISKETDLSTLILTIVEQERKIKEQMAKVKELDEQIETHECRLHNMRIKQNGKNYVQESYLNNSNFESEKRKLKRDLKNVLSSVKSSELGEYMSICENIMELEDKLKDTESKNHDLTLQLFEESRDASYFVNHSNESTGIKDQVYDKEIVKLKQILRDCLDSSSCQENDMQLNNQSIELLDEELLTKYDVAHELSVELGIITETTDSDGNVISKTHQGSHLHLEQENVESSQTSCLFGGSDALLLNKSDDSDTGVSSLHSTSDDSSHGLETLV